MRRGTPVSGDSTSKSKRTPRSKACGRPATTPVTTTSRPSKAGSSRSESRRCARAALQAKPRAAKPANVAPAPMTGETRLEKPIAAILAVPLPVNLPVALATTLYTNPLTIGPLYVIAYWIGTLFVHSDGTPFSHPPGFDWSNLGAWLRASFDWMLSLGKPLAVGLVVLAVGLAIAGYVVVQLAWRVQVVVAWRRRRRRRATGG